MQLDQCKTLGLNQKGIDVKSYTEVGKRIAHNTSNLLWIDKNYFSKDEIIAGLKELDCFPIIMPVSGNITDSIEDTLDMKNWIETFKRHGFDEAKNFSYSFELQEPKQLKDMNGDERLEASFINTKKMSNEIFDIAYDLYQMSKSFKTIDHNTKVYFIRNKLTRSFMRSKIKFNCSLTAIGGGFYHTGGERIKRLLDNLPKKLYYSTSRPLSYQWKDRAIMKI